MLYADMYTGLKDVFDGMDYSAEHAGLKVRIRRANFTSSLTGAHNTAASRYRGINKKNIRTDKTSDDYLLDVLDDTGIPENASFNYYIFENISTGPANGVIFLFHGLNEKRWDKYLPWACELTRQTNKAVILFPIAFHMNRAPEAWSDFRLMNRVASQRLSMENNSHSSFANAALSERLELIPERFLWSGLQTYTDFYRLVDQIRQGKIPGINVNSSIDLFGYSIGAFFTLLLMMDNPANILENSRLFIFCGGAAYDRSKPVSKYIIDQRASCSVTSYFDRLFEDKFSGEKKIASYFLDYSPVQSHFCGIMNFKKFKDLRENRMAQLENRIKAFILNKDDVIPAEEVVNTLKGESNNLGVCVETSDFDFPYNHITPFPLNKKYGNAVDSSFKTVFEKAADFLA